MSNLKSRKISIIKKKVDLYKETPEARKKRVSSGAKCRGAVFASKRRKLLIKAAEKDIE
jgi:hypothetical protein